MTYNFDPDKWHDNELFLLQSRLKSKRITQVEYDKAVEVLEEKLDHMWKRLDGTYRLPLEPAKNTGSGSGKVQYKYCREFNFFDNIWNTPGTRVFQGFGVPGRMILIAPAGFYRF